MNKIRTIFIEIAGGPVLEIQEIEAPPLDWSTPYTEPDPYHPEHNLED